MNDAIEELKRQYEKRKADWLQPILQAMKNGTDQAELINIIDYNLLQAFVTGIELGAVPIDELDSSEE